MESGKKSIKELFIGDKLFYVPNYQRSYSWTEKHTKDFFDDFKAKYSDADKKYYYGTILLQKRDGQNSKYEQFEIVDGQQRLTTLIVFIKCLIDKLEKNINKFVNIDETDISDLKRNFIVQKGNYVLTLQSDDNDFFHTYILQDNKYTDEFRTLSQKRLYDMKQTFIGLLNESPDDKLESFVERINSTIILVYLVTDRSEAAMIFETTNDRGKQLTNIEKTKSYLMYKASLLTDSESLLEMIQSRFNSIYQDFASFESKQINEDSVLQYTFIAYEKWSGTGNKKQYQHYMEFMKNKVESFFENNDEDKFREYIDKYTLNLKESFATMNNIYSTDFDEFKDLVALDIISIFYPLLIKTYRFDDSTEKANFRKVCRLLEIFVFRVYVIQKYFTSKFQTKWYELTKRFDGNFHSLTNSIIDLINDEGVGNDQSFISALEDKNFYRKYSSAYKNYFFWKYENYLRSNQKAKYTLMSHEDLKKKVKSKVNLTIEHIVAQKNTDEHSKIMSNESIITVGTSEKFNREYLHAIGNLSIDPQSANSSKGKLDVDEKISKYFIKAPYMCQNELESFLVNEKWKIESQTTRQKALVNFARKTWCTYQQYYVRNVTAESLTDIDDDDDNGTEDTEIS